MNTVSATSKNVRISTRKIRLVADAIRNLPVDDALVALKVSDKRGAGPLEDTLKSAIANANNNLSISQENLLIQSIIVNEGQAMKRFHPSTRGRVHPYKRRASHITITLQEKEVKAAVKVKEEAVKKADKKTMKKEKEAKS